MTAAMLAWLRRRAVTAARRYRQPVVDTIVWLTRGLVAAGIVGVIGGQPDPGRIAVALALGILAGLLAGGHWRRKLRIERDAARADVDRWNHADIHYALDEVGSIAPDRRHAEEPAPAVETAYWAFEEAPAVTRYEQDDEEPMCSWCEALATTRIDLPGARDLPSCDPCVARARLGDVTATDAYPDNLATTYGTRLQ